MFCSCRWVALYVYVLMDTKVPYVTKSLKRVSAKTLVSVVSVKRMVQDISVSVLLAMRANSVKEILMNVLLRHVKTMLFVLVSIFHLFYRFINLYHPSSRFARESCVFY